MNDMEKIIRAFDDLFSAKKEVENLRALLDRVIYNVEKKQDHLNELLYAKSKEYNLNDNSLCPFCKSNKTKFFNRTYDRFFVCQNCGRSY